MLRNGNMIHIIITDKTNRQTDYWPMNFDPWFVCKCLRFLEMFNSFLVVFFIRCFVSSDSHVKLEKRTHQWSIMRICCEFVRVTWRSGNLCSTNDWFPHGHRTSNRTVHCVFDLNFICIMIIDHTCQPMESFSLRSLFVERCHFLRSFQVLFRIFHVADCWCGQQQRLVTLASEHTILNAHNVLWLVFHRLLFRCFFMYICAQCSWYPSLHVFSMIVLSCSLRLLRLFLAVSRAL